ncbi:hypothetical protein HYW99_02850 [Candidatus Woesearchaeota archaeon]|nr:hypothetical protein [Candidatus Woesearchaeota archaeon]
MYVKAIKLIIGFSLIAIGLVGLLLPLVPGTLLVIVGFLLLGWKIEDIKEWFKKLKF